MSPPFVLNYDDDFPLLRLASQQLLQRASLHIDDTAAFYHKATLATWSSSGWCLSRQ